MATLASCLDHDTHHSSCSACKFQVDLVKRGVKGLVVYTVVRRTFMGVYGIAYFKTRQDAQAYITDNELDDSYGIEEHDGVYNGPIKLQSAEDFHANGRRTR